MADSRNEFNGENDVLKIISPDGSLTLEGISKRFVNDPHNKNQEANVKELMDYVQNSCDDCVCTQLGGNNIIVLIEKNDGSASMIVQLSKYKAAVDHTIDKVNEDGKQPWLVQIYAHSSTMQPDQKRYTKEDVQSVTFMKVANNSLQDRAAEIRENNQDVVQFAANIGIQISNIFNILSDKDILWTDLKPGNVLLDENDQVIIADMKAFYLINELVLRQAVEKDLEGGILVDKQKSYIDYNEMANVTESFVSRDFNDNKYDNMELDANVKSTWEKEYSYQMAVLLYNTASGQERLNYSKFQYGRLVRANSPALNNPECSFNFDHPVFQSEEGKRLKFVIKRLSHDIPEMRMSHQQASEMLNVIGNANKEKFNVLREAVINETKEKEPIVMAAIEQAAQAAADKKEAIKVAEVREADRRKTAQQEAQMNKEPEKKKNKEPEKKKETSFISRIIGKGKSKEKEKPEKATKQSAKQTSTSSNEVATNSTATAQPEQEPVANEKKHTFKRTTSAVLAHFVKHGGASLKQSQEQPPPQEAQEVKSPEQVEQPERVITATKKKAVGETMVKRDPGNNADDDHVTSFQVGSRSSKP